MDCPWSYFNKRTGGSLKSGSSQKYRTLSMDDLRDLKSLIKNITEKDVVLFLWVTNPMLQEGLELCKLYGFEYKTLITWVKENCKGLGYWYRGNTEHIILGIKGTISAFHSQQINVFHAPLRDHSRKPTKSYELIEEGTKNIPNLKILEMFARRKYPNKNWTCIGYDIDKLDIKDSLKNLYKI